MRPVVPSGMWRTVITLALMLATVALTACSRATVHKQEAFVFGTRVDVAVWSEDAGQANAAMAAVLREFDRLHRAYHAWEPSELTALNAALARGESHTVSDELAMLLTGARQMAAEGDYLFDPALGRLIALWGFHSDEFAPKRPDPAALAALLAAHPSMADVDIEGNVVRSRNPSVQIDLGGYAKGYALDRALTLLRDAGIHDALVNIGGNVAALGGKGDLPWRIGIQHPREPRPLATLPLYDGEAIGTSGDYQRYFELDGQRYPHLLDPRTGEPAIGTQALTLLVGGEHSGLRSDGPSKPAFIAGDDWYRYTTRFGINHALRVRADGGIELTRAMRARIKFVGDSKADLVLD